MAYPGEHSLRVNDPAKYKKFRRQNDKFGEGIDVIFGITGDGKAEIQAIRFDATKFSEDDAKKWAKEHNFSGTFEPAAKTQAKKEIEYVSDDIEIEYIEDIDSELTYELDEKTKEYVAMKTEGGQKYPAEAYLYVPDPEKPSTWKLRIWESPSKKITRAQLGRAAAAFSPGGFRGNKVELPADVKEKIKKKLISLYKELGVEEDDIPKYLFEKHQDKSEKYSKVYNLKDVEIFSVGKWEGKNSAKGGDEYTREDLDEMVRAFKEIGDKIKPPLKLGHDSKQKLLQKEGYPAAGWITNLKRVGDKLVADISNIPAKIYELIKNKAYGRFSPEIIWNYKDASSGKRYKRVLAGLALLGADLPACDTIDDFIDLYGKDINELEFVYIENKDNSEIKEYTNKIEEDNEMEKLEELKEQYELKIQEYEKKVNELTEEIKNLRKEVKKKEADNFLEKAIEEGKITPAQKHLYMAMILRDVDFESDAGEDKKFIYTYKEGENEKKIEYTDSFELVKQLIENNQEIDFSKQTRKVEYEKKTIKDDEIADIEIAKKAEEYARKNNVSYKEALLAVAEENR